MRPVATIFGLSKHYAVGGAAVQAVFIRIAVLGRSGNQSVGFARSTRCRVMTAELLCKTKDPTTWPDSRTCHPRPCSQWRS